MKAILGLTILAVFVAIWLIKLLWRSAKAVKQVGEAVYEQARTGAEVPHTKLPSRADILRAIEEDWYYRALGVLGQRKVMFGGEEIIVLYGELKEIADWANAAGNLHKEALAFYRGRGWYGTLTDLGNGMYMVVPNEVPYAKFHQFLVDVKYYLPTHTPVLGVLGTDNKFYHLSESDFDIFGAVRASFVVKQ